MDTLNGQAFSPNDVIWIFSAYVTLMGVLEFVRRWFNRHGLSKLMHEVAVRSHDGKIDFKEDIQQAMQTLLPRSALLIPVVGALVVALATFLIQRDSNTLPIQDFLRLGEAAAFTAIMLFVVLINDLRCILAPPWPKQTKASFERNLEGEPGTKILARLKASDSRQQRKQLRDELATEQLPNLFRPFVERFFTQQAIRLGGSVALLLCAILASKM